MAGAELVGMSTYELFEFSCKSESKRVHTCEDMARDERQSANLKPERGRCETCCSQFCRNRGFIAEAHAEEEVCK